MKAPHLGNGPKRFLISTAAALVACASVGAAAQDVVQLKIDPDAEGPVISRHIFGQFAEHLGTGIYNGVWVGEDSSIPNTRGIRNDVVAALKEIEVPNVRWPGGCFADEYHWRDGIGPKEDRVKRRNASWAGRIETNAFGTHEFMDFLDQIGAEPFISANIGSGTVQEASDWLEYLTAEGTTLADERAENGHPEPYGITFWGIGNESWDCGGPFTAEEYVREMKQYLNFATNYNPDVQPIFVAVGPDVGGYAEYTETVMKAWSTKSWTWDIQGLSLHNYTRGVWPPVIKATSFGKSEYAMVIDETLGMNDFIETNAAIMDKYDPERHVGIIVDEWGTWYESDGGTLYQQNSMRDAVLASLNFNIFARHADRVRGANIAQMVNVLQAMILTDDEKMLLTPTYHAFHLYTPFQDAERLPVDFKPGQYREGEFKLPRVDALAARDEEGILWVAMTNIDADREVSFNVSLDGQAISSASGHLLGADAVDSINTFDDPENVTLAAASVRVQGGDARITLPPHSVAVIALQSDN